MVYDLARCFCKLNIIKVKIPQEFQGFSLISIKINIIKIIVKIYNKKYIEKVGEKSWGKKRGESWGIQKNMFSKSNFEKKKRRTF